MVMIVQPVKTAKTTELCTFKNFLFYIGVELINNVALDSGIQQSDSQYTCIYSFSNSFPI